mgnify:CR=1 FL=1
MRMRTSKLEVFEVLPEDRKHQQDGWGWMELDKLAKMAGLVNFQLLIRFIDFGTPPVEIRGRKTRIFYYMRRRCRAVEGEESFELRSLDTAHFTSGTCEDCRCGESLTEHTLYRFVEKHPIRVPARWANEVIAELRKNPVQMPS